MLRKDSKLVELNLFGEKEEGLGIHAIVEMNQFEMF